MRVRFVFLEEENYPLSAMCGYSEKEDVCTQGHGSFPQPTYAGT